MAELKVATVALAVATTEVCRLQEEVDRGGGSNGGGDCGGGGGHHAGVGHEGVDDFAAGGIGDIAGRQSNDEWTIRMGKVQPLHDGSGGDSGGRECKGGKGGGDGGHRRGAPRRRWGWLAKASAGDGRVNAVE